MFRTVKWAAAPLLALAVMFSVSTRAAKAADEAKGTVTGTVVGADDKPSSGTLVRLFHPMEKGNKAAKSEAKSKSDGAETKAAADKPAKGDKPVPVATATTDKDGKFEMKDVPAGKYTIMANVKGVGNDRENIEVKAGESASVSLKLEKHEGKVGGAGGEKKAEKSGEAK